VQIATARILSDVRAPSPSWADFPEAEIEIEDVAVVRGDRLSTWLFTQPTRHSEEDQRSIAYVVTAMPKAR
jgi:hypothetical protein